MNQDLTLYEFPGIDGFIAGWLHEKEQESMRTRQTYEEIITTFRRMLWESGTDLFPHVPQRTAETDLDEWEHQRDILYRRHAKAIKDHAQIFAALTNTITGSAVARSTHNLRLTTISSFYEYVYRMADVLLVNPIDHIKRLKRIAFEKSRALAFEHGELDQVVDAIPESPIGLRDRALISLGLYTGRRLSEITRLQFKDLHFRSGELRISLTIKGGREAHNDLDTSCPAVIHLYNWIRTQFGEKPDAEQILFISLSTHGYGHQLTPQGVSYIIKERLGDDVHFHSLRHTFAACMDASGATIQEISEALGHVNVAITSTYMSHLKGGKNKHIGRMAKIYAGQAIQERSSQ